MGTDIVRVNWIQSAIIGAMLTLLMFVSAESLSELFGAKGLELTHVILILIAYCLFVAIPVLNVTHVKARLKIILVLCLSAGAFVSLKGTEFIFYFWVHKDASGQLLNILIGCILGLGICISFSILFRFFLHELFYSRYLPAFLYLWFSFLAGQLSQITSLLSQVDLIVAQAPVMDISRIVNDSSEYGHILNALIGYESSPNPTMLTVYVIGLFIPLIIHLVLTRFKPIVNDKVSS